MAIAGNVGRWHAHGQTALLLVKARLLALSGARDLQHRVFHDVDDERWLWYNTVSSRRFATFRNILPTLPDEATQTGLIGSAGDVALGEGFRIYLLIKELAAKHGKPVNSDSRVLDFGCGFGRILRFFMKDVLPRNLMGVDAMPRAIELSAANNPWGTFELIPPFPPTSLASDTFDLIYLYSVFSHLSEEAHLRWLEEFRRILRPGGILFATTWPRDYIERCERARTGDTRGTHAGSLDAFRDTRAALARYDRGEFCHSPVGGGDGLPGSFYGESCIPEAYVKKNWTPLLEFCEFKAFPDTSQNTIVMRKRPA